MTYVLPIDFRIQPDLPKFFPKTLAGQLHAGAYLRYPWAFPGLLLPKSDFNSTARNLLLEESP